MNVRTKDTSCIASENTRESLNRAKQYVCTSTERGVPNYSLIMCQAGVSESERELHRTCQDS